MSELLTRDEIGREQEKAASVGPKVLHVLVPTPLFKRAAATLKHQAERVDVLESNNKRLVEALSEVMDWCAEDRRLPMDLFGVANHALAKHREVFGNE